MNTVRSFLNARSARGRMRRHEKLKPAFKLYGLEALRRFDECMKAQGIPYALAFGSMLGAVREHGFIAHDFDIDTWMFIEDDREDLLSTLKGYGFELFRYHAVDKARLGKEYTLVYKGVHLDIFFIYPPVDVYPYCTDYHRIRGIFNRFKRLPRRIELPFSREFRTVPFEGMEIPVFANTDELCRPLYGDDYMTPNPGWDTKTPRKAVVEWRDAIRLTAHRKFRIRR